MTELPSFLFFREPTETVTAQAVQEWIDLQIKPLFEAQNAIICQQDKLIESIGAGGVSPVRITGNGAEQAAYPCSIISADFGQGTVVLQMEGNYRVSAGPKLLVDAEVKK